MTESSIDQRRGSQLDDQSNTCPTWCKGGHGPVDDFHMSEPTGEWVAEVRFARSDDAAVVKVWLERHIDENGLLGQPRVIIEGELSECENMAEFSPRDALRLATAVTAAAALAEGSR